MAEQQFLHEAPCCQGIEDTISRLPPNATTRVFKLIDLLRLNAEGIRGIIPTEDDAVKWALSLYDKHIRPIEIKWLGKTMNQALDDAGALIVEQAVRAIFPG